LVGLKIHVAITVHDELRDDLTTADIRTGRAQAQHRTSNDAYTRPHERAFARKHRFLPIPSCRLQFRSLVKDR
jgi:hypothetical protein